MSPTFGVFGHVSHDEGCAWVLMGCTVCIRSSARVISTSLTSGNSTKSFRSCSREKEKRQQKDLARTDAVRRSLRFGLSRAISPK